MAVIKKIKDPVHNYIFLSELEAKLADTTEMQRLRRIKQVATAYLVYPGANHTRFEHSLGVCHIAHQCCQFLSLDDDVRDALCAAALLHDVGHGPFSHVCEDALSRSKTDSKTKAIAAMPHEEITKRRIEDKAGSILPVLKEYGIKPSEITDMLAKTGKYQSYGELISGDIDVDRMDYLVRDAHYTGVSVGFDVARLATSFTFHHHKLAIKESGLNSAEALLFARFLMYSSVYFHRAVRSSEKMLVRAIECAINEKILTPKELYEMDDIDLIATLRKTDGYPKKIFQNIENRRLLKCAYEKKYNEIKENVLSKLLTEPRMTRRMEKEIAERCKLDERDIIIDAPSPPIMQESQANVLMTDGTMAKIEKVSKLVSILSEAQKDHWMLRVFAPEERRQAAKAAAEEVLNITWW